MKQKIKINTEKLLKKIFRKPDISCKHLETSHSIANTPLYSNPIQQITTSNTPTTTNINGSLSARTAKNKTARLRY